MATEKPIAELTIIRRENGGDSYRLEVAGALVWNTRAHATVVGRDGARSRMAAWLARHPHDVRMVGVAPAVVEEPWSEQEIEFWRTYEKVLGGRLWSKVAQLLGKPVKRPTTLAGWHKLFEAVDQALKAEAEVA